ncbi:MAG: glycosyltransferase family 9 protein [Candidatus Sericytochromatia bacterium]|nr:glycosyltransferase family 9 protein [Candidatus Sericytochromatia bacterium]
MRIGVMKAIDHHLGRALCAALSVVVRARSASLPLPGEPSVQNVAVVKFWGMGSLVLLTPAIAALKGRHPHARLFVVTQAANREVVGLLPGVDGVLTLEVGRGPLAFLASLARLVRDVRRAAFDVWLDAEFLTRFSALLTAVSGARLRVGFHVPEVARGRFHHVRMPFNGHRHMVDNFLSLVTGELTPPAAPAPLAVLAPDAAARTALTERLAALGVGPDEPLVVLNPNAGELALERRWPVERFGLLAGALLERWPGRVVFVGAPAERAHVARALAAAPRDARVVDLSGQTDLGTLVALFARARLLVSNDTGPLHLACAVGTPTVSIFGPETPVLFGPRGPRHRIVYRALACSPCLNVHNGRTVRCPHAVTHCVEGLPVEAVLAAVEDALRDAPAALPGVVG